MDTLDNGVEDTLLVLLSAVDVTVDEEDREEPPSGRETLKLTHRTPEHTEVDDDPVCVAGFDAVLLVIDVVLHKLPVQDVVKDWVLVVVVTSPVLELDLLVAVSVVEPLLPPKFTLRQTMSVHPVDDCEIELVLVDVDVVEVVFDGPLEMERPKDDDESPVKTVNVVVVVPEGII